MLKNLHALIQQLEQRSPTVKAMNLTSTLVDEVLEGYLINLANNKSDLERFTRIIEKFVSGGKFSTSDAEKAVRLLISERHLYGTYCELGAYEWLDRHNAEFRPQVSLTGGEVLNPNGCDIDGKFEVREAYFDIKGFGFQSYVRELFRRKLEAQFADLIVLIDGPSDISVKDVETYAFGSLKTLQQALLKEGRAKIDELGWTVRAEARKTINMSEATHDPYRLAEENRYYPLKTAGQFARNVPFVIIFPYAAQFNSMLSINFSGSTDVTFRAMARRAFFQLPSDTTPLKNFDKQTPDGATVSDAAHLLSAILFIDLDKESDGHLFLNPRATYKLTQHAVQEIFDFMPPFGLLIDDFAHDDY